MTEHERPTYRVLSTRTIVLAAVALALVGAGLAVWLILAYGGGSGADRARLDALRTAGTIVIGTGGAAALWLAARRQRTGEIALMQKDLDQLQTDRSFALQERAARATEEDAAERRVTDLYAKAVEQLGSDKAPVRLGGMYALERLAQNVSEQRQVIVNVLCAYLRMPYDPDAGTVENKQEREVRLTAQRLLANHLRPGEDPDYPVKTFWPEIDLDLTGAALLGLNLSNCRTRYANFAWAHFVGGATFSQARFGGTAIFNHARFDGKAAFELAAFESTAMFRNARMEGPGIFSWTRFNNGVHFDEARFTEDALLNYAVFIGLARFAGVVFEGNATFDAAEIHDGAARVDRESGRTVLSVGGLLFASARFGRGVKLDNLQSYKNDIVTLSDAFYNVRVRLDRDEKSVRRRWPPGYSVAVPDDPRAKVLDDVEGDWGLLTPVPTDV